MSDRFLTALVMLLLVAGAVYLLRDRIPSPNVSRDRPFVSSNGQRVLPSIDGGPTFEVLSRPGMAGPQYFCAAAEYARSVLRAEMNDVLVTLTAEAPSESSPDHRGVIFELRPAAEKGSIQSGIVIDLSQPGQSRSITVAMTFCR
ncbi:MAG: hypothetical protein QNI90_05730 [Dinoroseobacter sp.]|nr:hypothetical protein [Dinoroseobacter sp.]MDJ0993053.1 hypothetical protein [Dinoroseobacter sp.]